MAPTVEDEHMDLLQNIEWSILTIYRAHPDLTDYQVESAMEALGRSYAREKAGDAAGAASFLPKNELPRQVYESMQMTCNWRMGRETGVVDENNQPIHFETVDLDTILSALKRLRKSLSTWTKRGGTRGYLNYISNFMG